MNPEKSEQHIFHMNEMCSYFLDKRASEMKANCESRISEDEM